MEYQDTCYECYNTIGHCGMSLNWAISKKFEMLFDLSGFSEFIKIE
jgi:hypothetical protein